MHILTIFEFDKDSLTNWNTEFELYCEQSNIFLKHFRLIGQTLYFIASAVFVFVLSPIVSGFYESDSDWTFCEKIKHALCSFLVTIFFLLLITLILYFTIAEVRINYS